MCEKIRVGSTSRSSPDAAAAAIAGYEPSRSSRRRSRVRAAARLAFGLGFVMGSLLVLQESAGRTLRPRLSAAPARGHDPRLHPLRSTRTSARKEAPPG